MSVAIASKHCKCLLYLIYYISQSKPLKECKKNVLVHLYLYKECSRIKLTMGLRTLKNLIITPEITVNHSLRSQPNYYYSETCHIWKASVLPPRDVTRDGTYHYASDHMFVLKWRQNASAKCLNTCNTTYWVGIGINPS